MRIYGIPKALQSIRLLQALRSFLNINASPYHMGKAHLREKMISERASDNKIVIAYLNTVGGQDELVFDGGSFIADKTGKIIVRGKQFEEEMIVSEIALDGYNPPSPL